MATKTRSRLAKAVAEKSTRHEEMINRVVAAQKYRPTDEQISTLYRALESPPVLVIEAGAGSGKTTTLRLLADVLPGRGQYTAFNSSLVTESSKKFQGTRVSANTTHSLAFHAEGKRFSHRLNGPRVRSEQVARALGLEALEVTTEVINGEAKTKRLPAGFLAGQLLKAIQRFCQSADREISAKHFRYLDGIDYPDVNGERTYENNNRVREYLIPFAAKAWADLTDEKGSLPFSHDIYVKVWQLNHPIISADYVLLDEAQDTAPVMLDILRQQTIPVILVGDSAQSIYEWRGAVNAMAEFPEAPTEYLSKSFRFGQAVADVANLILERLSEPTKLRLQGFENVPSRLAPLTDPDCILSRTNAAAISAMLSAMANGKRVFLVGGGADVAAFVRAAIDLQNGRSTSHPDLACFDSWTEVKEYADLDEGEDLRLMVKLIDQFGAQTILDALKRMPEREEDADLTVCTAHKSKGREWKRVKLAGDFPSADKSSDSDLRLLYVAATRAQWVLDVTDCPPFLPSEGDGDYINILPVIAAQPSEALATEVLEALEAAKTEEPESIVEPAPSVAPRGEFSWTKFAGVWNIRGPKGAKIGDRVTVTRKNGSTSTETVKAIVHEFDDAVIYSIS